MNAGRRRWRAARFVSVVGAAGVQVDEDAAGNQQC